MPMSDRLAPAVAACWLACMVAPAWALDSSAPAEDSSKPAAVAFSNAMQALRQGVAGYRTGDMKSSVEAFKYAAANGNPLARWKLGRMYAAGDGVPQDDVKAFEYFSQIVQNYDEDNGSLHDISIVSNAFVAIGVYDLNGIANSDVKPDADRAMEMFKYAALNFGSADAQYNLARLYLDGASTIPKDVRQAARWMALAADKNHKQAQALLGHMLFNGVEGVPHQRARGLMWLTLAKDAAGTDPKDAWIVSLYDKAAAEASDADREVASLYVEDRRKHN